MSKNKFQTKEFKKLKDHWYDKLEKSGFKDIEQDENNLKQWESHAFGSRYNSDLLASNQKYFELAGQFLHENTFSSKRDKKIWELHSEGFTIVKISDELKKRRYKTLKKSRVHKIVQELSKEMLKKYGNNKEYN